MKLKSGLVVFLIIILPLFFACKGKEGGAVKLPISISTNDDGYSFYIGFDEYDKKNRIVKYSESGFGGVNTNTIIYRGDEPVKIISVYQDGYSGDESIHEINISRNGNIINFGSHVITVNKDGYMVKLEWSNSYGNELVRTYQYHNGNMIKMISQEGAEENIVEYEYDNMKSPFYQTKTPKWLLVYYFQNYGISSDRVGLNNNIIAEKFSGGYGSHKTRYEFEYDSDGFPAAQYRAGWHRTFTYQNEISEYEGGPGHDYQALPNGFSYPYTAIMEGDLSEFAGVWVNGGGSKRILSANGLFFSQIPDGQQAYNFSRGVDAYSMASNGTDYSWVNESAPGEDGMIFGFIVTLFPVGVDISIHGNIMHSDTTKDRIIIYAHESPSLHDNSIVYYQEKRKLLHYVQSGDDTSIVFEYDALNRITRARYRGSLEFDRIFRYTENNSVIVETNPPEGEEEFVDGYINYSRNGNEITYSFGNMGASMFLNYNENILVNTLNWYHAGEVHAYLYEYRGGNAVSKTETVFYDEEINTQTVSNFRYDNMKSPFFVDFTPNWLLQIFFSDIGIINNIVYESNNITDFEYQYEYDSDGYPTRRIRIHNHGGTTEYETTYYFYFDEWIG